ncbi:MAG: hypothetical protein E3J83_03325 [Candidatus Atribacteria bacterium]|nr:MAG: hypothetical protein E3J83_03325 [Candidatus Atribacteria bacterium]
MKELNDFIRDRRNGRIYWVVDIDHENKIYTLEYIVKVGFGLEEDEKATMGFSFDEVKDNFDEEASHYNKRGGINDRKKKTQSCSQKKSNGKEF